MNKNKNYIKNWNFNKNKFGGWVQVLIKVWVSLSMPIPWSKFCLEAESKLTFIKFSKFWTNGLMI
jgi:hypothetical protein